MIFTLMSKLRNIILRGKIVNSQQDGKATYTIQTQSLGHTYLGEAWYPYGYAGSPPTTGGAINLAVSCQPENIVSLPYDPTTRWKDLQPGEVQIGNQLLKTFIKFNKDGTITIQGNVNVTGNITSSGNISDQNTSMLAMRNAYNSHFHADPQGGNTGGPSAPM